MNYTSYSPLKICQIVTTYKIWKIRHEAMQITTQIYKKFQLTQLLLADLPFWHVEF
jgi:hypothetical protein